MRKKAILIILVWFVLGVAALLLYRLRGVPPLKEFIEWATGMWPILTTLGAGAVALTVFIIKHDFNPTKLKDTDVVLLEIKKVGDTEKGQISTLMELSSLVEHKMERYFRESLQGTNIADERVAKWETLVGGSEFQELSKRLLAQRAVVSVISPELDDSVRLLLSLLLGLYRVTLSKQYMDEIPKLSEFVGEVAKATETARKRNTNIIKQLIG